MVFSIDTEIRKIIHISLLTDPKGKYWRPQDNNFVPFFAPFPNSNIN